MPKLTYLLFRFGFVYGISASCCTSQDFRDVLRPDATRVVGYFGRLVLIMVFLPLATAAQQLPHYTMYMANNYVLNPALAGIEPYVDLKLAARTQWVGINNAPKTAYATINSPLNIRDFPRNRIGIGGKLMVDQTGPIMRSSGELNGAYHLPVHAGYRLSFGVGVGINYHRVDINRLQLVDPRDPIYATTDFSRVTPAVNVGLWYYATDLFIGLAGQNMLESDASLVAAPEGDIAMKTYRHFFATAGYRFKFDDFYLTPSVMLKAVRPLPLAYDVNVKGQFADVCWAGITWRHQDGVAAMVGFFVSSGLNVAYAYDFTNSDLRRHSYGSHEIMLGININNQRGPKCPTYAW